MSLWKVSNFAETHQPVSCQSNQTHFCTLLLFQRLCEVNSQVTAGFISRTAFPASLSVICSAYAKVSQFLIWKTRNGINATHASGSRIQTIGTPCKCMWILGHWWDFLGDVHSNNNVTVIPFGLTFIIDLGVPAGKSWTLVFWALSQLASSGVKGEEHGRRICSSAPRCTAKLCLKSSFGDRLCSQVTWISD